MTPRGQAFVASMEAVKVLLRSGLKPFVAMSAGLEDDDWLLVYAARPPRWPRISVHRYLRLTEGRYDQQRRTSRTSSRSD